MKYRVAFSLALLTLASFTAQAKYDGEDRGKPVMPSTVNAKFVQECAGCHMAFPPGLLPAASWTKMMAGLDKHFDVDASVTPAEATEITNFLVKNASNRWTATTAPLRITDSVWFKTKHSSREVAPAVWKRASIKSASNCMACHTGADKGDFNEHNIKIPK
ncbi:MAG: diheme cytochrome c [Rhodoferax sp.]|jgi:mono/diheme cytochrome c family protein|nr:diheme cytochrome c [Rhodoferax sp.]